MAFNREVDLAAAELLKPVFLEIVMAPSFSAEALELLRTKKNLRLLKVDMTRDDKVRKQYVSVNGGLLVQDQDTRTRTVVPEMCVTDTKPQSRTDEPHRLG